MGAHPSERGTWFTVWAPNARAVGVIGSFNNWHGEPLHRLDDGSGRWSGHVDGAICFTRHARRRIADPLGGRWIRQRRAQNGECHGDERQVAAMHFAVPS